MEAAGSSETVVHI